MSIWLKKISNSTGVVFIVLAAAFALAGCEQDGPMENAGEEVDQAVDEAADNLEEAGDEVEDELDDIDDN